MCEKENGCIFSPFTDNKQQVAVVRISAVITGLCCMRLRRCPFRRYFTAEQSGVVRLTELTEATSSIMRRHGLIGRQESTVGKLKSQDSFGLGRPAPV
ncbi:unnamed protein product [Fusarium venenatum]|uniref:Uncharacterized protein n=1 Tax=Fusarium venenatum TaxID=56646 RepID=A0A2L2U5T0_9HYPO|nr:uncharacterized protein FVRRES_11062 [Fusarium venenatum]CEI70985.1 unnamed protein product [Fusarium venenatum]